MFNNPNSNIQSKKGSGLYSYGQKGQSSYNYRQSRVSGPEQQSDDYDEEADGLAESGPIMDDGLHTIRDEKDSQDSIIERKNVRQPQNLDHMVDSYEIYGEKQPEDSDEDEEPVHQRGQRPRQNMRGNNGYREELDGIGEINIIEPNKMQKSDQYTNKSKSASNQIVNRKQGSNTRERRENSGAKKTQIEILDDETPI